MRYVTIDKGEDQTRIGPKATYETGTAATAARRKVLSDICLVHLAPLKQDLKAKFSALHRQDRESICPAKRQHRAKDESRSSTARHASQNLQLFNAKATQRSRNFGHASN